MGDKPEDAPHNCPGTESEEAGKASACAGCPNQQLCASAPKGPDPDVARIAQRLSMVKHKVLVLSGKGGVGKSTVSAQLAWHLASRDLQVALLDIDICGPSIPRMVGQEGQTVRQTAAGWAPVYPVDNLAVLSIGFLLNNPNEAVVWRGPKKNGLIKQFLKDVDWGEEVDIMIVDCPPGTSDEHLSIVQLLKDADMDGAIIVTTPNEVAMLDVKKELSFCKKVGLPVLGVVENMASFSCPCCGKQTDMFNGTKSESVQDMCDAFETSKLGSLPLEVDLVRSAESGKPFLPSEFKESVCAKRLSNITNDVCEKLGLVSDNQD